MNYFYLIILGFALVVGLFVLGQVLYSYYDEWKDKQKIKNWIPNKLTTETLTKSERGEDVHQAKDANDLFDKLDIK